MNIRFIVLLCLLYSFTGFAQTTILSEDFESGALPVGWTNTQSTPSVGWEFGTATAVSSAFFIIPDNGTLVTVSNDDAHDDNTNLANLANQDRIITQAIITSSYSALFLEFESYYNGQYGSIATVEISTDGGSTWTVVDTVSPDFAWASQSINLNSYIGQTINIAFRHNDSGVWATGFAIDNVLLYEPVTLDAALSSIDITDYALASLTNPDSVIISGVIANSGITTITSLDVNWTANGGAAMTMPLNGLSLSSGQSMPFTHSSKLTMPTPIPYNINVWLSNVNGGSDADTSNNDLNSVINGLSFLSSKNVLAEQSCGAWGGWAPDGDFFMRMLLDSMPNVIPVNIHNGDAMEFADGSEVLSAYITAYPQAVIDRVPYMGDLDLSRNNWINASLTRSNVVVPVGVSVLSTFNISSRVLTATVEASVYGTISGDYRVNVYVLEDSVTGAGTGYDQANYLSNNASYPTHPNFTDPNPIVGYNHMWTLREMLGGAWGTAGVIPNSTNSGNYSHQYTDTIPASMNESNMRLVAVVQKYDADINKREVLNCVSCEFQDTCGTSSPPNNVFAVDAALDYLSIPSVAMASTSNPDTICIQGQFSNQGTQTITSIDVNWSVNGGLSNTMSLSLSLTSGQTYLFIHNDKLLVNTVGPNNISVWLSNPNGVSDDNPSDNQKSKVLHGTSGQAIRNVLVEEADAAWSGWNPDGHYHLKMLIDSNANIIPVNIHNGDAMEIADGLSYLNTYGFAYPQGSIDRVPYSGNVVVGRGQWPAAVADRNNQSIPYVGVSSSSSYNSSNRNLSVSVTASIYDSLAGDYRVNVYLMEDSVTGVGSGYDQANFMSNNASFINHPNYSDPNPITGYNHRYVLREMLGGPFGTAGVIPSGVSSGNFSQQYTYTVPAGMDANKMYTVALVQKYSVDINDREVLNCMKCQLSDTCSTFITEPTPTGLPLAMSDDTTVCPGSFVQISVSALAGTAPFAYQWAPSASLSNATLQSPLAFPFLSTTYSVTVTDASGEIGVDSVTVVVGLEAPTGIFTDRITPTKARFNWAPVSNAHHYEIRAKRMNGPNWVNIGIPAGSPNYKNINGLNNNVSYVWQVRAFCTSSTQFPSEWSVIDTFTAICNQPDSVWTSPVSKNAARFNWTKVVGASGYDIRGRKLGNSVWTPVQVAGANTVFKDVFNLKAGTAYEWRIRTLCDPQGNKASSFTPSTFFVTNSNREATFSAPDQEWIIYPNPTTDKFYIETSKSASDEDVEILLFSNDGRLISAEIISDFSIAYEVDMLKFPTGVYQVLIKTESGLRRYKIAKL